jgi:hypothetical protein
MFQIKFLEKIKTHIIVNNFFHERGTIYELMKNMVEPDRPQMAV